MDRKLPILKSKEWITILACMLALSMLTVAVYALSQVDDGQLELLPSTPAVNILPSTGPATLPTDATLPAEPELPSGHLGAALQDPVVQPPLPPVLKLNELTKKDFGKSGGYITCKTQEYWLGVDVSIWQEDIDWEKVRAAGFQFAMIRIAYRGWSKAGELNIDPKGQENLEEAAAAGLKVGVYIYSQATNVREAVEEAQYVLSLLDGRELDMPVVFDWEVPSNPSARTRNVKAKTMQACALAFCHEIKAAGYRPMVYFNQWQGSHKYDLAELREAGMELWLAMYTRAMTYPYKVQMWQYTSNGRVPGIDGRVDIDIYFPYH